MVRHCSYGTCKSDSRKQNSDSMKDVFFIRFPKPYKKRLRWKYDKKQEKKQNELCKRWINACGRPFSGPNSFTMKDISRETNICSKHFVGENGPSEEHPDPIIAGKVSMTIYVYTL